MVSVDKSIYEGNWVTRANARRSTRNSPHRELALELSALDKRLRDGEDLVRRGKEDGGDKDEIDRWEIAWIRMLAQYEKLSDEVNRAGSRSEISMRHVDNE